MRAILLLVTLVLALVAGCSCEGSRTPRRDAGPSTDDAGLGDHDANVRPGEDGGVVRDDVGFMGCDHRDFDAMNGTRPLDIVWVIDNSGSMDQEARLVQDGMNTFGADISASGIEDYHVVVITQSGWVTVPPPLGTDPTHFLFVDHDVQSHDPLQASIDVLPQYRAFLRDEASTHFVFVTDDESSLSAAGFLSGMQGALGKEFIAHVIVSPPGSTHCGGAPLFCNGCSGPYGMGAANGQEYWDVAAATLGQQLNICSADWSSVFTELTTAVAVPMPIPCQFTIPAPPDGMTFDRDLVNVVYTPGGGGSEIVPRSDCASGAGWQYDDPTAPTQILLCPSDCERITNDPGGVVQIELGCQTVLM